MDALIRAEEAAATAASSASHARNPVAKKRAEAASERKHEKSRDSQRRQRVPKPSAAPAVVVGGSADYDDDDDDDDEEEDEELAEHGFLVPEVVSDPSSAEEAERGRGRRVYLEGVPGRNDLLGAAGTIMSWRGKAWDVEMDRRDERILVASRNLRWLDQAPPPVAVPRKSDGVLKNRTGTAGSAGAAAGGARDESERSPAAGPGKKIQKRKHKAAKKPT